MNRDSGTDVANRRWLRRIVRTLVEFYKHKNMKTIIDEIIEYRTNELKAGRTPVKIPLSENQRARLKQWCESTEEVFTAPDGTKRISASLQYSDNMMILGMNVCEVA